jgi:hypothetical protein
MPEVRGLDMGNVIFVAAGVCTHSALLPLDANLDPGNGPSEVMVQRFGQLI